jgi:hypothetical protein
VFFRGCPGTLSTRIEAGIHLRRPSSTGTEALGGTDKITGSHPWEGRYLHKLRSAGVSPVSAGGKEDVKSSSFFIFAPVGRCRNR